MSLPLLPPVYTPTHGCWHPLSHRVLALRGNSAAPLLRAASSVRSQLLAPPAPLSPQPTRLQHCQKLLPPPSTAERLISLTYGPLKFQNGFFQGVPHTGSLMLGASSLSCLRFPLELPNTTTRLRLPGSCGKCYRLASSRLFLCSAAISVSLVPCHCRERRQTAGAHFPAPLNNTL